MAKLYFRYGTMGSAKTLNLLAVAHNYQQQQKKVLVLKPKSDTRFEQDAITSRAGLSRVADGLLDANTRVRALMDSDTACLLVDEVQFLPAAMIEQFREIATCDNVPVICYGLRTNYKSYLFEGAKRLLELADTIEEVKTTCHFCNRKAIMNLRMHEGQGVLEGHSIQLGAEDKYVQACYHCYGIKTGQWMQASDSCLSKKTSAPIQS